MVFAGLLPVIELMHQMSIRNRERILSPPVVPKVIGVRESKDLPRKLYRFLRYGRLGHQPWSLGAVTSRPSLESSLRAMSRSRPRPRKMRRRLTALAGATDTRII